MPVTAPVLLRLRLVAPSSAYQRFEASRQRMLRAVADWIVDDASTDRDVVLDEVHGTASAVIQMAELLLTGRPK